MNTSVFSTFLSYSSAFLLSLVVGHYVVVGGLSFFLRGDNRPHKHGWGVGCVERFIYTSTTVLGLPIELIGGWLVLKGLAQFKPREDDKYTTSEYLGDYYGYLIGTGLSLIVGVGFGLIGRHLLGMDIALQKS
jgi:hypothetical protein